MVATALVMVALATLLSWTKSQVEKFPEIPQGFGVVLNLDLGLGLVNFGFTFNTLVVE